MPTFLFKHYEESLLWTLVKLLFDSTPGSNSPVWGPCRGRGKVRKVKTRHRHRAIRSDDGTNNVPWCSSASLAGRSSSHPQGRLLFIASSCCWIQGFDLSLGAVMVMNCSGSLESCQLSLRAANPLRADSLGILPPVLLFARLLTKSSLCASITTEQNFYLTSCPVCLCWYRR